MKRLYFLLFSFLCSFVVVSQPYQVGKRTLSIIDGQRNNRYISTDIYYPANTTGSNVAIAGTGGFLIKE